MARFFGEPSREDWSSQLNKCASQLENVVRVNQTEANKAALEIVDNLRSLCDDILHPSMKGPGQQ